MTTRSISGHVMRLVATDGRFHPKYAFDCGYVQPHNISAEKLRTPHQLRLHHGSNCRYYLLFVTQVSHLQLSPIRDIKNADVDPDEGEDVNYTLLRHWTHQPFDYYLYKINQVTNYSATIDLDIYVDPQVILEEQMRVIALDVFFNGERPSKRMSCHYNITQRQVYHGQHHHIDLSKIGYFGMILMDHEPSEITLQHNNETQVYDPHLIRLMRKIGGRGRWCVPFYLRDFAANYVVTERFDVCSADFVYEHDVQVTYEFEIITLEIFFQYFNWNRQSGFELPSEDDLIGLSSSSLTM